MGAGSLFHDLKASPVASSVTRKKPYVELSLPRRCNVGIRGPRRGRRLARLLRNLNSRDNLPAARKPRSDRRRRGPRRRLRNAVGKPGSRAAQHNAPDHEPRIRNVKPLLDRSGPHSPGWRPQLAGSSRHALLPQAEREPLRRSHPKDTDQKTNRAPQNHHVTASPNGPRLRNRRYQPTKAHQETAQTCHVLETELKGGASPNSASISMTHGARVPPVDLAHDPG
jgi:hypothetical protein